jgi:hypothetical protein
MMFAPVHEKGLTFFDQVETSRLEELADDATITKQAFAPLHIVAGEPWYIHRPCLGVDPASSWGLA